MWTDKLLIRCSVVTGHIYIYTHPLSIPALRVKYISLNHLNAFRNYRRGLGCQYPKRCSCISDKIMILPNGMERTNVKTFLSVIFKQRIIQQDILHYCCYILFSSYGVGWT